MLGLAQKAVVITGGAGGIGRAAARAFAGAGARVLLTDLAAQAGEAAAEEIRQSGGQAQFIRADVSQAADVQGYVAAALAAYGRIDVFLNNAAWEGQVTPLTDYPDDVFDKVLAINVRGVFLGLKHVLPVMYAQGGGSVINTSSLAGHIGSQGLVAYTASKHAVLGMTKTAAMEGARHGVRVNAVSPGAVDTPMLHALASAKQPDQTDEAMRRYAADSPNGRLATPEDIANAMLFLASDLSSHMSGQSLRIDGGRIMYLGARAMTTRMSMFRKRPDLSDQAFRDYWAQVHAPIALRIPALQRYEQNCVLHHLPSADPGGDQPLDGICKLDFASAAAMQGVMSPDMARILKEDEAQFLHGLRTFVVEPQVVVAPTAPATKCVMLITRRADQTAQDFAQAWALARAAQVAAAPSVVGYVQNHVTARSIARQPAGHDALPVDCIDEIWFAPGTDTATIRDLQQAAASLCARISGVVVSVNIPAPNGASPQ